MFVLIIAICFLLFFAGAGADLLVSDTNLDELNNMGVERN